MINIVVAVADVVRAQAAKEVAARNRNISGEKNENNKETIKKNN